MPALFTEVGYIVFDYLAVDVVVADAIATVLEYVAIAEILNAAQHALAPSAKSGVGAGLESNYYNAEASIRIIYGTVKCGGMQTIPPITYGSSGQFLAGIITLAGHEVNAITDAYFDNTQIASANIGSITGAATDGLVSGGKYINRAWIRRYTGTTTQSVDWILNNNAAPSQFTANFRGRGIAYVATQLQFDQNVYVSVPNQSYTVQGKKVYDPRLDSTQPGGSGSQRVAAPSTWTFQANPALCLADYLMAIFGGEYDPSEIDWTTVMTAANVCDFTLTGANTTPDGDQKRYTCNGAMLATQGGGGQPFSDNVALLVNAMMGRVIYANGIWSMFAGTWQTPNTTPINKNDWISGLQVGFEQGRDKRFNESHCWFISPTQNWQRVECSVRQNPSFVTADGGEIIPLETDQPFCTVEKEAQRKAEVLLRQSRNQITVSGKLPPRFSGIKLWDTISVNYADFGWTSKTFRVAGCTSNLDGSVDVSLSEEGSSDWVDMLTGEYNNPDVYTVPSTIGTTPSTPPGFGVITLNGALAFSWSAATILPKGTHYQLLAAPDSLSPPSSKQVVWTGDTTYATLINANNSPMYYQVQAYANSDYSGYNPNTFGVLAAGNYQPGGGAWNAYLAPSAQYITGPTATVGTGIVNAVVNSPGTPVFSWTRAASVGITLSFGVGSASQQFVATGMANNESRLGNYFCNIKDGSNVTSIPITISLTRFRDPGQ